MKPTRIFTMIVAFLLGMLMGWYGGIELFERGLPQLFTMGSSLLLAGWVGAYPGRYKDEE